MAVCPINIPLSNGSLMPALGLGTSSKERNGRINETEFESALNRALEIGYRHIDTAAVYRNEKLIGRILKQWLDTGKIRREELFICTKLPGHGNRQSSVEKYLKRSLADLQLSYVDLYLIHNPVGFVDPEGEADYSSKPQFDYTTDIVDTWKGMEAQVDAGRVKAIGLSNFNEKQIQRILDAARIKPANLQVELHSYFQQRPLVEFCRKNNISVVGYAPLGCPSRGDLMKITDGKLELPYLLNNETVLSIANKHKKSASQILLRHLLQLGIGAIPKSANPERVAVNFQVFDFELDASDMKALNKLDQGSKGRGFDFKNLGFEVHPEYPF